MSAARTARREVAPVSPLIAVRKGLAEANQLGAKFRLSGSGVQIERMEQLPAGVLRVLQDNATLLWTYLGGAEQDDPALALVDKLGVQAVLVEDRTTARDAVRQLLVDVASSGYIGLDIETASDPAYGRHRPCVTLNLDGGRAARQPADKDRSGLDPHRSHIALLQLYAGGDRAFVFRGAAAELVLRSHWLRRQHLVVHNLGFELAFLRKHCRDYRPLTRRRAVGRMDCTMQAAGLLCGVEYGGGRSLANASQTFLQVTVPKTLQTSDWSADALSSGQIAYAAADAVLAWKLWLPLQRGLRRKDRWNAYALQRSAILPVVEMELRGLGIDLTEHKRQTARWAADLAEAHQQYAALTGKPPPTKPAEVREWLITVLSPTELASWGRTATGELSTVSKHLKPLVLRTKTAQPVLDMMARAKLLSVFGSKLASMVNPVTGRLHTHYSIAGTKAGRFSASVPNLQQLPSRRAPEFKRCVVAAPGNVLIGCDWSQIELRAAAWISGDVALTELYANGRDLHAENAAAIANVSMDEVTQAMRTAAKAVSFGALYGIGPTNLAINARADYGVEMSEDDAREALDRFFSAYPQLRQWRKEHFAVCQQLKHIKIGIGRVVEAAWEGGSLSFPQCCNLPIQGICADAMLRAIVLTHSRLLRSVHGGLVASVHDELLLEVHADDGEIARKILQDAMLDAFTATFPGAPTNGVADAKIGATWAEVH